MAGPEDDRLAVDLLIRGFQVSRTIRLVADLGIADRIAPDGKSSVADLAAASGVLAEPLLRAIRALAAFGIFRVDAGGMACHTPRSLLLRSDAPDSLHPSARFWTAAGSWRAWEALDAALHGRNPHQAAWGTSRFDYLRSHPDEARIFDAFMANFPDDRHAAIATAYDFTGVRLIADIGGGNGETLRRILALYPAAKGIVFDRADVVAAIPPEALAGGRITPRGGSFFDGVPAGANLYLLVRVLHDWPDEDATRILRSCRSGMAAEARLLVVEGLIEPDPSRGRPTEYLTDMQMMAMFGTARERTEAEFGRLLDEAGFALTRAVPTGSAVTILEAAPAP
ncbi:methyltransferase [Inquilinus sp. Marseille-Q2685]|uniref:methyltransferase n=1 Tax=Inquilinus sp. Marseille-Q2685 TaxID=2866581 RepID=UPI001CE45FCD|nr:methyltransferase [Inquilinus sp. Marseille-Q2685]